MRTFFMVSIILFFVAATVVNAQVVKQNERLEGYYAGFDAMSWKIGDEGSADDRGVRVRFGSLYDETFSSEIQLGGGGTGTQNNSTVKLDLLYSVFFQGILPLEDVANLYAKLGFSQAIMTFDDSSGLLGGGGSKEQRQTSSLSYGGGVEIAIAEGVHLNGDFIQYLDKTDLKMESINAGISWEF